MQYLKDEVRNNIIDKALSEFKEKGYLGASIRSIAKKSNSSVGNIYKYFDSKESLYENIIGSVYNKLMDYIDLLKKAMTNHKSDDILYDLMNKIIELFKENSLALTILFNKSEGSQYEDCIDTLEDIIIKLVTNTFEYRLSQKGKRLKNNFIIRLMVHSLIESTSMILEEKEDGGEVRKYALYVIDILFYRLESKLDIEDI